MGGFMPDPSRSLPIAPDASITEGKLSVYALMGKRKSQFLKLAWHLRTGKHVDLSEVFHVETTQGRLVTKPSKRVIVDGEIQFRTPVKFSIAPDVLKVMVPQDFKG
jgi:diacylglycerol kinase family enzyme